MKLTVLKNKRTGQVSINIPKGISDLYKIDEKTKMFLEPKSTKKTEFVLILKK